MTSLSFINKYGKLIVLNRNFLKLQSFQAGVESNYVCSKLLLRQRKKLINFNLLRIILLNNKIVKTNQVFKFRLRKVFPALDCSNENKLCKEFCNKGYERCIDFLKCRAIPLRKETKLGCCYLETKKKLKVTDCANNFRIRTKNL